MLANTEDKSDIADLNYELWQMARQTSQVLETCEVSTAEEHRQAALKLYLELYEKTPKFEYKKRIGELQE